MKLDHEFIQLAQKFDIARMQKEVAALPKELWTPHHEGFKGNYSIPLVSRGGLMNNEFKGPMACTHILDKCLYLRQVIASFGEVVGRSRLMALDAGCQVPVHSDINYHWYKRVRIHVPIVTDPDVIFKCANRELNMQAGEAWIFDSWKYHQVNNNSSIFRIHLVIDICGSSTFWHQAKQGAVPWISGKATHQNPLFIDYKEGEVAQITTEQYNVPLVMSPGEVDGLAGDLIRDVQSVAENEQSEVLEFVSKITDFCHEWRCLWTVYGMNEPGWKHYHTLRQQAFEGVQHLDAKLSLLNGTQAPRMFLNCIIDPALNVEVKDSFFTPSQEQQNVSSTQIQTKEKTAKSKDKTQAPSRTLSRNAPCYCGSGMKFKACHGKLT